MSEKKEKNVGFTQPATKEEFLSAPVSRGEMIALVNRQLQVSLGPIRADIDEIKEQLAMHMQCLVASEAIVLLACQTLGITKEEMEKVGGQAVAEFDVKLKEAHLALQQAAKDAAQKAGHA
jgi:hypothetical protein